MSERRANDGDQPTAHERAARDAVTTLLRAADVVRRSMEETFRRYELTGQQYNVLRILRGAGEPLPTMAVAERMMEKTPGLTGILDRLEAKHFVERRRSTSDRRVWLCAITERGRALLGEMDEPVRRANVNAVRGATEAEMTALTPLLRRIADAED